jgi:hypothetical protein
VSRLRNIALPLRSFLARCAVLAAFLLAAASVDAVDIKKWIPSKKKPAQGPVGAAGVRGLDEPGSEGDLDARDLEAVDWMEARKTSEADLKAFLKAGGLEPLP